MSKNFKNRKSLKKVYEDEILYRPETSMEQITRLVRQLFEDFKSCFRVV